MNSKLEGGHFDIKDILEIDPDFENLSKEEKEDIFRKVNVAYGENHNITLKEAYEKAKKQISQSEKLVPVAGGAKKANKGSSYITESTKISQALVKDFKVDYKPAIMQKCLSAFRKHSKASDAVGQLKDAEKYIREHKDEFIKMYEKEIKDAENKKKTKKSTTKKN